MEYRIVESLYPDSEVLKEAGKLVGLAIGYVRSGNKPEGYEENRNRCLRLLKIYNFASWQYGQEQSTGRVSSSVSDFDNSFLKTMESLKQDEPTKILIEKLMSVYLSEEADKEQDGVWVETAKEVYDINLYAKRY